MKNRFYLTLSTLALLFTACGNNEQTKESIKTLQHTSYLLKNEDIKAIIKKNTLDKETKTKTPAKPVLREYTFTLEDLGKHSTKLHVKNDIYKFSNIGQSIVMVTFFSTWCPPCRGQIPHLNSLQKKFKDNLFILSALVHDDIEKDELKKFIISHKVKFYISNTQKENLKFAHIITPKLGLSKDFPLPLMVLFVNGKYFTHYEGIMPEEMIESDIKQLLEKINNKGQDV
jgi:thiol-disulfide isomerase/thioredoxin